MKKNPVNLWQWKHITATNKWEQPCKTIKWKLIELRSIFQIGTKAKLAIDCYRFFTLVKCQRPLVKTISFLPATRQFEPWMTFTAEHNGTWVYILSARNRLGLMKRFVYIDYLLLYFAPVFFCYPSSPPSIHWTAFADHLQFFMRVFLNFVTWLRLHFNIMSQSWVQESQTSSEVIFHLPLNSGAS